MYTCTQNYNKINGNVLVTYCESRKQINIGKGMKKGMTLATNRKVCADPMLF
jgi:hypothetical protein